MVSGCCLSAGFSSLVVQRWLAYGELGYMELLGLQCFQVSWTPRYSTVTVWKCLGDRSHTSADYAPMAEISVNVKPG